MTPIHRVLAKTAGLALGLGLLAGCAVTDLDEAPAPMGRFLLGHNIAIVSENVEVGPMSRTVDSEQWVTAVRTAVNDRFSRYDGDRYFHISVAVLGYVLAQPGIPIVAAPRAC